MLDAIRFTFVASPAIAPLIVIASLYTFGTAALTTLLPVFGKALFQFGPVEVGYFWSALGVGFLLVSLALLFVSEWSLRLRVHLLAVSSAVAGVALVVLLSTKTLIAAVALMAIVGLGIGTLTPIAWGILQEQSPLTMLGRVMGLYTSVAMLTSLLGIWFFGWITQTLGEANGLLGIGGVLLLVGGVGVLFSTRMSRAPLPAAISLPCSMEDGDSVCPSLDLTGGRSSASSTLRIST
jgi:MFS family permease